MSEINSDIARTIDSMYAERTNEPTLTFANEAIVLPPGIPSDTVSSLGEIVSPAGVEPEFLSEQKLVYQKGKQVRYNRYVLYITPR